MQCPHCNNSEDIARKFCTQCGQQVFWTCFNCQSKNVFPAKYCGDCGSVFSEQAEEELLGQELISPVKSHSEHRQVTVLFCDVINYTRLTQRIDSEDLLILLRSYQDKVQTAIRSYGGFVARLFGDGVMAYFGFPVAQEHAVRRAVNAALKIKAEILKQDLVADSNHESLKIRIGIATGKVIAGDIVGNSAAQHFALVGETPNLAARIQSLAQPNSILVTQSVKRILGNYFVLKSIGMHRIKGFDDEVQLYEVIKPERRISRFEASRWSKLVPFIGRSGELLKINQIVSEQRESKKLKVIAISGEAGIGKSRLIHEYLSSDDEQHNYVKLRYHCSPLFNNSTLHPIFVQLNQIWNQYDKGQSKEKILSRLRIIDSNIWNNDTIINWLSSQKSHTRQPLRVDKVENQLFESLLNFSYSNKTTVIFEDLHWADPSTLAFIKRIIDNAIDFDLVMFITFRKQFKPGWPETDTLNYLSLESLDQSNSKKMIMKLLGNHFLPPNIINDLIEKTSGIPFLIEELMRSLVESMKTTNEDEVDDISTMYNHYIPPTVYDLLMSRLDQLGQDKEIVQIASVLGHRFKASDIAYLAKKSNQQIEISMVSLQQADVIVAAEEEDVFKFRHVLMQEAAYECLLMSKRRFYHSKIARLIVKYSSGNNGGEIELVAHHFALAGEYNNALNNILLACKIIYQNNTNRELLNLVNKGIKLLDYISQQERSVIEPQLYLYLGNAYQAIKGLNSRESEQAYQKVEIKAGDNINKAQLIDSYMGLHTCYYIRGDLNNARLMADKLERTFKDPSQVDIHPSISFTRATNCFWEGRFSKAKEYMLLTEKSDLQIFSKQSIYFRGIKIKPIIHGYMSWLAWIQGDSDLAKKCCHEAISNVNEIDQPFSLGVCIFWISVTKLYCGEYEEIRSIVTRAINLAQRHRYIYLQLIMEIIEGNYLINQKEYKKGFELINHCIRILRRIDAGIGLPWSLANAAEALIHQDRIKESEQFLDLAMQRIESNHEFHWLAEIYRIRALCCIKNENFLLGSDFLNQSIDIAKKQGALSLELRSSTELAKLFIKNNKQTQAIKLLKSQLSKFDVKKDTPDIIIAKGILSEFD